MVSESEQTWPGWVALKNQKSEIYYAYHFIHRYVEEPFTNIPQETLLYSSRFLWAKLQNKLTLPGILSITEKKNDSPK